ncbi:MAG TPA: DUF1294 domain-containing protein [Glaciihabitans sp.]|nr:DUF1294 domain-containing protein [Glaciihabitans sp.]
MDALWIGVSGAYLVMSVLSFVLYSIDKSAARSSRRRIPEQTLLLAGFACGWPGALIAQRTLRHKTRKRAFLIPFWITVVLNVAAVVGLIMVAGMLPLQ